MSRWTDPFAWEGPFLEALRTGVSVVVAAAQARTSTPNVYVRRGTNSSFREAWDAAALAGREVCAQCGSRDLVTISGREQGRKRCRRCASKAASRYKATHPERHTTEARRPEARSYYERNREKINRDSAEWRRRNPERRREILRRYASKPEVRLRHRRPGRRAATYVAVLLKDPCSYCGAPVEQADHIVPVARGGLHDWENLTGSCRQCNMRKLDNSLLGFLAGVIVRRV